MANTDLNAVLAALVADQVNVTLAPYNDLIARMNAFLGIAPSARRGPGRPPKTENVVAGARRGGLRSAPRAKGDPKLAAKFSEGQAVKYRQGRGTFEAKVIAIDTTAGTVTVERDSDGKKVRRPAAKLIA